jgi:hypothetical protein
MGGSSLQQWVANHYLRELGLPELHLYDSDVPKYQEVVDRVKQEAMVLSRR